MATDLYATLEQAIPAVRQEFETLLRELVQIPTVSMDPAHAADIQQGAYQAAAILQAEGDVLHRLQIPAEVRARRETRREVIGDPAGLDHLG